MFESFSPNMLKTFELCPKKFYFKYVKNISMPVDDEKFEFGKNIHALASYYLRKENIDKMELSLTPNEKEVWEYLKGVKYFGFDTVETEYNLSSRVGTHFFGGRIDALIKDGDKYYILDYKTGAVPKNATYDYQTIIYLLGVSKFFNTDNITFVYLDLRNKKELSIELTSELKQEYENKLLETAARIEGGEYQKKKDTCPCEYKIICY